MSVVSPALRRLPATVRKFAWLLLLTLAPLSQATAQPAWPAESDWVFLGADPEEGGLQNDQRDVESLYYTVRDGYLFLRMKNRGPAGWCMVCGQSHLHARYKWMFDTAGSDGVLQGGHIRNTEFMLLVEDDNNDLNGEITFIDSVAGDYNTRWDSSTPPRYVTNTPVGAPFTDYQRVVGAIDGSLVNPIPDPSVTPYLGIPQFGVGPEVGYRVFGDDGSASPYSNGIYVDVYLRLTLLGSPSSLRLMWLTD